MEKVVKDDALRVLAETINAIKKQDYDYLIPLSNRTIHNAVIYQDDISLAIAILVYALGKVTIRSVEKNTKLPDITPMIAKLDSLIAQDKEEEFNAQMKDIFKKISETDKKMHMYIEEVMHKARLKKGSKLYEHCISLPKVAEMLGVSQWDLLSYVGILESHHGLNEDATQRFKLAREIFK